MSCPRCWAVLISTLVLCPVTANAQSGPLPGYRERELAQIIREAGYDCSQVEKIAVAPNPPPGWEVMRPESNLQKRKEIFGRQVRAQRWECAPRGPAVVLVAVGMQFFCLGASNGCADSSSQCISE
jgi:hypothetical protein